MSEKPFLIWIFGLPSAGKSTLAWELRRRLTESGRPCLLLDGDELRGGLCHGLGFSAEDRSENLRRAAEVAALSAHCGVSAVTAMNHPTTLSKDVNCGDSGGFPCAMGVGGPLEECRNLK